MIDTPLEIFLAGALAGAVPTFLLCAHLSAAELGATYRRVGRLRAALTLIALGDGFDALRARGALDADAAEEGRRA